MAEVLADTGQTGNKNSEIINDFLRRTVEDILKENPDFFKKGIVIKSDLAYNNRLGIFIENTVSGVLVENKVNTFLWREGASYPDKEERRDKILFEITVEHYSLKFEENTKAQTIKRKIKIGIYIKLLDFETQRILLSDSFEKDYTDEISASEKKIIESEKLSSPIYESKKNKFMKYLEPAVVSIISGVIVYLFFSVRSR